MANAVFLDKVGNRETLDIADFRSVAALLKAYGIPKNCVITRVNGIVVSEDAAPISDGDDISIFQIRHYDLGVTRRPPKTLSKVFAPLYSKEILFENGGDIDVKAQQFTPDSFVEYIESVFVEGIQQRQLFQENQRIAIGLSGGRDSVAFVKLLERTRERLPQVDLTAVTVTGLPDWDEPKTLGAATAVAESIGIKHVFADARKIDAVFRLKRPFLDIMTDIVSSERQPVVMAITHHVMRRLIETEAEERGIETVILGLNSDDLVATLVTWFTSGYPMGPIPSRQIGKFQYIFPLYRITKKELTLYLEVLAPELNSQGSPGTFTTGPAERSLAYAVTDHLFDLWPGIDYYVLDAFARIGSFQRKRDYVTCGNCGAAILDLGFGQKNDYQLGVCDVCAILLRAAD